MGRKWGRFVRIEGFGRAGLVGRDQLAEPHQFGFEQTLAIAAVFVSGLQAVDVKVEMLLVFQTRGDHRLLRDQRTLSGGGTGLGCGDDAMGAAAVRPEPLVTEGAAEPR